MKTFYVFQHALAAIAEETYRPVEDILRDRETIDIVEPTQNSLIGDPCLFKLDQMADGMIYGRLVGDVDSRIDTDQPDTEVAYIEFPIAEYLFAVHKGPMLKLNEVYDQIRMELETTDLHATYHPILVFPHNLPHTLDSETTIEIWVATDADITAPEVRLSDGLMEALPRTSFNFYTW